MNPSSRHRLRLLSLLLLAAALYLPRLNGDWYYLYGEEATGLTLTMSLASGQGYHDISLPGSPPHVREPFLFYFLVSLLERVFGLNLWVFKGLVVLAAILTGPAAFWLFRKLAPPRIAWLAALLTVAAPFAVDYAAQFRPDPLANLLLLVTLALLETSREQDRALTRPALLGALALLAAYLVRSTALAVALAWPLALALAPKGRARWRLNLHKALIVLIPFALGFGLWESRNHAEAARSGLTYSGRYLLGAEPDSLTIMAEDFHAPLHPPWPRATPVELLHRVLEQLGYYGGQALHLFLNWFPDRTRSAGFLVPALLISLLALAGYLRSEWSRRSLTSLSLPLYLLAIAAWPMRAPRQTFILLPFLFLYCLLGGEAAMTWLRRRRPRWPAAALVLAATMLLLIHFLLGDLQVFRQARRLQALPLLPIRPGLFARILSPGRMNSARVLLWARDHLPAQAVLMFHSPPPCYLVTGHQCSSIPFEPDPKKVRDFLVGSAVSYIIVDGWESENPRGPAQFAARFLNPALERYPKNFQPIFRLEGTAAAIYQVLRPDPD